MSKNGRQGAAPPAAPSPAPAQGTVSAGAGARMVAAPRCTAGMVRGRHGSIAMRLDRPALSVGSGPRTGRGVATTSPPAMRWPGGGRDAIASAPRRRAWRDRLPLLPPCSAGL